MFEYFHIHSAADFQGVIILYVITKQRWTILLFPGVFIAVL